MTHHSVIIIGGGIAGLTCATYLHRRSLPFVLLEAADEPGGRVRTDFVDGFCLDRGFQIFLTSYPEAKKILDYDSLQLQPFRSGALIRQDSRFIEVINPLKEPLAALPDLFSPVGTWADKMKIVKLVARLSAKTTDEIFSQPASSTISFLKNYGFSPQIIRNFFKPFFGGVFLEKELATSGNFFCFVFKQFAVSDAVLPMKGIQQIPNQLAARLPSAQVRSQIRVKGIEDNKVFLADGQVLTADCIVLAADAAAAAKLGGRAETPKFNQTSCVYFAAPHSPLHTPMLVINPDENSLINNMCVPSDIARDYAPSGKSLISVSIVKPHAFSDEQLPGQVSSELSRWFGTQVDTWQHLKTYHLPQALPSFTAAEDFAGSLKISDDIFRCGDYTAYPSLNGAMQSGREVASMVAEKLSQTVK